MKLVKPDYFQIAWLAQARWLNDRSPESFAAFERAMEQLLAAAQRN